MCVSGWGFHLLLLTGEVSLALVDAVVLAAGGVVPFHAQPGAARARHLADVADGAEGAVVGEALAWAISLRHLLVLWAVAGRCFVSVVMPGATAVLGAGSRYYRHLSPASLGTEPIIPCKVGKNIAA